MLRRRWLFCSLLLTISCGPDSARDTVLAPQFANAGLQQSVHGRIHISFLDEKDTFTAVRKADGSVTGEFDVHSSTEGHIHGRVVCFTIEGNSARLAGIVERADDFPSIVGGGAMWTVRDNGEGSNDPDDVASDIRYGIPAAAAIAHCSVSAIREFEMQRTGNIQINE
jgi:hypothetical protein